MQQTYGKKKNKHERLSPTFKHSSKPNFHDKCIQDYKSLAVYSSRSRRESLMSHPLLSPSSLNSGPDFYETGSKKFKSPDPKFSEQVKIKTLEVSLDKSKQKYDCQIKYLQEYISSLKKKIANYESIEKIQKVEGITDYKEIVEILECEISHLKQRIAEKTMEANSYLEEIHRKKGEILELNKKVGKYEIAEEINRKNLTQQGRQQLFEIKIRDLEGKVGELRVENEKKNKIIEKFEKTLGFEEILGKIKENIKKTSGKYEFEIEKLHKKLETYENRINSLTKALKFIQNSSLLPHSSSKSLDGRVFEDLKEIKVKKENQERTIKELQERIKSLENPFEISKTVKKSLKNKGFFEEKLLTPLNSSLNNESQALTEEKLSIDQIKS